MIRIYCLLANVMDMELDEIFQWQTPFCSLLADIGGIEEDGIDGMLDQIGFPELQEDIVPVAASVPAVAATEEPISSPLWPCDLVKLPPVHLPEVTKHSQDPVGSPQSSSAPVVQKEAVLQEEAPFTPAVAKPKRTRASKSTPRRPRKLVRSSLRRRKRIGCQHKLSTSFVNDNDATTWRQSTRFLSRCYRLLRR